MRIAPASTLVATLLVATLFADADIDAQTGPGRGRAVCGAGGPGEQPEADFWTCHGSPGSGPVQRLRTVCRSECQ
ncbi:hypothetical protein BH20CHL4_BH20CHL4_01520 [soil metagenome]